VDSVGTQALLFRSSFPYTFSVARHIATSGLRRFSLGNRAAIKELLQFSTQESLGDFESPFEEFLDEDFNPSHATDIGCDRKKKKGEATCTRCLGMVSVRSGT
jgi:hypothetical protein